jgi:hypothetical protein
VVVVVSDGFSAVEEEGVSGLRVREVGRADASFFKADVMIGGYGFGVKQARERAEEVFTFECKVIIPQLLGGLPILEESREIEQSIACKMMTAAAEREWTEPRRESGC